MGLLCVLCFIYMCMWCVLCIKSVNWRLYKGHGNKKKYVWCVLCIKSVVWRFYRRHGNKNKCVCGVCYALNCGLEVEKRRKKKARRQFMPQRRCITLLVFP